MLRNYLNRAASLLFASQFVALDIFLRGASYPLQGPRIWISAAQSIALWLLVSSFRTRRPARSLIALMSAVLLTSQWQFHRYYHVPIDVQVIASAVHNWSDVAPVVFRLLPATMVIIASVAAVQYLLLTLSGKPRLALRSKAIALASLIAVCPSFDFSPPDLRAMGAVRLLFQHDRELTAKEIKIPPVHSPRSQLPNVLFVITESIRDEDYCSAYQPNCQVSPRINEMLPERVGLKQMRSIASYTVISLSALLTGRTQELSRDKVLETPMIFDYARALRQGDKSPKVLYWSSQSESVFERKGISKLVDSFVSLETLVGSKVVDEDDFIERGVDKLLAEYFVREIPKVQGPFLMVLHLASTHAPYYVDSNDTPFTPYVRAAHWSTLPQLRNAYRNSIHEQDKRLAQTVRAFLDAHGQDPWMIVFTSDHGEAFGEHGAIHHGQNLYEEQIHVPGFIATSAGLLTAAQKESVEANSNQFVTHLDIVPTILDAYGILDSFEIANHRKNLAGRSLLTTRQHLTQPIPVTNCTGMFPCPVNTWGLLLGPSLLTAQVWDNNWNCMDLPSRSEHLPFDQASCKQLLEFSKKTFPKLPNGDVNPFANGNP